MFLLVRCFWKNKFLSVWTEKHSVLKSQYETCACAHARIAYFCHGNHLLPV
jgi:hypothetical protein